MATDEHTGFALDELEHQALDTLDATPRDDPDHDDPEVVAAIATAEPMFARLIPIMAARLLDAAGRLAATEDRGTLDPSTIARLRARIGERPELALGLPSAVEAVGVALGLEREGMAWAVLLAVGERGSTDADDDVRHCAAAIAERLAVAYPRPGSTTARAEPSAALRVFRSAAVAAAGAELRARFLAADHPELLALARELVATTDDPEQLVAGFDAARAALAAAGAEPQAGPDGAPEVVTDGPKRKFTRVHLILALIVLGLTVWHYAFR